MNEESGTVWVMLLPVLVSATSSVLVSRLGSRMSLIDKPNERSSHVHPTPRAGGIGIFLSFLIIGVLFTQERILILTIGMAGLIGLLDDCFSISSKKRLLLQLIISAVTVILLQGTPDSARARLLFGGSIIFITGTANFYNFMDGINGIAGLTGVVGFGMMALFSHFVIGNSDIVIMSIALSAACVGFLPFNFPKANVFMGDVGSVSLGFIFAAFVVKLSTNINVFLCLIMFLCLFYADALITIFSRWLRGENLMKAHRSHLYQYLSNELRLPHWKVSVLYAFVQLTFGLLGLLAYRNGIIWQLIILGTFSTFFMISYLTIKSIKPRSKEGEFC